MRVAFYFFSRAAAPCAGADGMAPDPASRRSVCLLSADGLADFSYRDRGPARAGAIHVHTLLASSGSAALCAGCCCSPSRRVHRVASPSDAWLPRPSVRSRGRPRRLPSCHRPSRHRPSRHRPSCHWPSCHRPSCHRPSCHRPSCHRCDLAPPALALLDLVPSALAPPALAQPLSSLAVSRELSRRGPTLIYWTLSPG